MVQDFNHGFDPDIRKFFRRIIWSSFFGLLWLIAFVTGGIYYRMAYAGNLFKTILFYLFMLVSLYALLKYLKKAWK